MNKEINEIFEQWKQFLSWCYENNDKTTEIHRDSLERVMAYTRKLENIIKEVREWAKKCSCQFTNDDGELVVSEISFNIQARPCDLFKILDKEDK